MDYRGDENPELTNDLKFSDLEERDDHEPLKVHSLLPEILEEISEREATVVTQIDDLTNNAA